MRKRAELQHPSLLLPDRNAVWPAASHSGVHTFPVKTVLPTSQNKPLSSIHCICSVSSPSDENGSKHSKDLSDTGLHQNRLRTFDFIIDFVLEG